MNLYTCSPRQVYSYIIDIIQAGLVPYVRSSPGMGKSSIMRKVARNYKLKMIDHRLSTSAPEDMSGLPHFQNGFAKFSPFRELFPTEDMDVPDNYDGWLVFLDEFNAAPRSVQAAAYKLVLDRMTGQHRLHQNVAITAAGNLDTDRAITNPLSTAMQSRVIHLDMELNHEHWMEDVAITEKYDARIIAYLNAYPKDLMDFRPDHENKTFCCPRTWEFMNALVKGKSVNDNKISMYAGTITPEIAAKFVQFTQVFATLVSINDVLRDPQTCPVPYDTPTCWAIVSHLMDVVTDATLKPVLDYIMRFDLSFRIIFFRGIIIRNPTFRKHPAFISHLSIMAKYLND